MTTFPIKVIIMKRRNIIWLFLTLLGCSHNIQPDNESIVDLVDSVVCKSYFFCGDSLVRKSDAVVFVFSYDENNRLLSYCRDNRNLVKYNSRKSQWSIEMDDSASTNPYWFCVDGKLFVDLWGDIINLPIALAKHHIDSISIEFDDYWKRNTNIDFSNQNGWICNGYENNESDFRVSSIIEYYPSFIVYDSFGYTHGLEDLPRFISQKRSFPNGFSQIITYKVSYKTVVQRNDDYYDTLQFHVPYINDRLPNTNCPKDNPEESIT